MKSLKIKMKKEKTSLIQKVNDLTLSDLKERDIILNI